MVAHEALGGVGVCEEIKVLEELLAGVVVDLGECCCGQGRGADGEESQQANDGRVHCGFMCRACRRVEDIQ